MSKGFNRPPYNPAGRGQGVDGVAASPSGSQIEVDRTARQREANELGGKTLVQRKHTDWIEHQMRWRFLLDSFEGGDRYRNAVYGPDRRGLPIRNLARHKREYPDAQEYPNTFQGYGGGTAIGEMSNSGVGMGPWPGQVGADPYAVIGDDDYELRRARTPVPEFVAEALEIHLAKVYDQEVSREAPPDITEWWKDVDGRGTPVDDYMKETIAPLLLVLGCLDIALDHPQAPPGEEVNTRADELRLGLDKCVASYILPQNMIWWRNDPAGRYKECLVREYADPSERVDTDEHGKAIDADGHDVVGAEWRRNYIRFRYWTATESILFTYDGDEVLDRVPHNYGRVPIVRLMDLKKHRTPNVGKSRYEEIAELQREFYNRDSELILSDTLQAHPFLSGAEDFCKADNTLSVGPGYVLPMKKNVESGSYQGWEYVSPPKDPADSLRKNKMDLVDLKDRRAFLMKPAGTDATTTGQSGISKALDAQNGHKNLTSIAKSLAKNERFLAEYAAIVLRAREITPEEREKISVVYPARFELFSAPELIDSTTKFQAVLQAAGAAPEIEGMAIRSIVRQLLLGLTDKEYEQLDNEVDLVLAAKAQILEKQQSRMAVAGISDAAAATEGPGSTEQQAGTDPTGESGATRVSNSAPAMTR